MMWWRKKAEKQGEMNKRFIGAVCADGIHGGIIALKGDAFYFSAKRNTAPVRYNELMIPYDEIQMTFFTTYKFLGTIYPVTRLVLKNGKSHDFVVLNQKKFLININKMCQW